MGFGRFAPAFFRSHIEYTALFEQDMSQKVSYRAVYGASAMFSLLLLIEHAAYIERKIFQLLVFLSSFF